MSIKGCILPNVNTVAKKRLDTFLQEARICECAQLHPGKECSTDPRHSLRLPELCSASQTPLLEFENGRALTLLPGLFLQREVYRSVLP